MEALVKFLVIVCSIFELIDCLGSVGKNGENLSKSSNCFCFTWLGPKYNARSNFRNATCADVIKGDKSVPCVHPLVVTNNSNVPNMHYIWDEYQLTPSVITCQSMSGEACVKFAYKFNGAVENITYFCSKVNIVNESAISSGCYTQTRQGHEVEVCVCQSDFGGMPCNRSASLNHYASSLMFTVSLFVCIRVVFLRWR